MDKEINMPSKGIITTFTKKTTSSNRLFFSHGNAAWLIPYTAQDAIAVPLLTCQEIVERPQLIIVPGAAPFIHGLIEWHQQWLALLDLDCLVNDKIVPKERDINRALVLAYRGQDGKNTYGALSLLYLPRIVSVQEDDFSPLPADNHHWPELAVSCFKHEGNIVPILDPARLFTQHC